MAPHRRAGMTRAALLTRRAATLLLGAGALASLSTRSAEAALADPIARSQLAAGDPWLLRRAFAKARRGEPLTFGVIGGSITCGAIASSPDRSYVASVLAWWRARFPQSETRLVNAGLSGTGSLLGAFRVQRDLLQAEPDVVIVEFAVNDAWVDGAAYEGLLRQILARPNAPAVVPLFMMFESGGGDQEMQSKVGAHYNLPMVSVHDALWPDIAAGRIRWHDYFVDNVHPNDAGHAFTGRCVTALLEASGTAEAPRGPDPLDPLPAPLHSDAFQFVEWRDDAALTPARNDGWTPVRDDNGKPVWAATSASGRIAFDWSGTGIVAQLARPPDDQGRVRFWIDDVPSLTLDASAVIKRNIVVVAEGLARGQHRIAIERLDPPTGAGGENVRFGLAALGPIGVRPW
ncbi:MAG TPA: GDSL-type esterase/lipase family protein [Xanthobacteraceae bacterium]|nr:GDSL-type esterase/lipase family protein [Xanthobacteraceae bacterium]